MSQIKTAIISILLFASASVFAQQKCMDRLAYLPSKCEEKGMAQMPSQQMTILEQLTQIQADHAEAKVDRDVCNAAFIACKADCGEEFRKAHERQDTALADDIQEMAQECNLFERNVLELTTRQSAYYQLQRGLEAQAKQVKGDPFVRSAASISTGLTTLPAFAPR